MTPKFAYDLHLDTYDQAGHFLGEYDGSGNLIQETVWLGDIPVATLQPSGSSVAIYYVVTDQLDTPRKVIRPSDNALMWTWFTGLFGVEAPNTNPQGAGAFTYDLRFPGQIAGAWGSTYQNYFRDYDPAVGRYLESDPLGLKAGVNTRLYSNANPISIFDKSGLEPTKLHQHPSDTQRSKSHVWTVTKMHPYNGKATSAAIPLLALLCACLFSIGVSAAQRTIGISSRVDHAGLIVVFSISCSGHTVQLDATITNQTQNSMVIESGTLPWEYDILGSEFVAEASGRKLKRNWTAPLIGRVGPITLTSHERRSGTVPISTLFPRLGAALKTSTVVVHWKYQIGRAHV